jgi:hypothetical protein
MARNIWRNLAVSHCQFDGHGAVIHSFRASV